MKKCNCGSYYELPTLCHIETTYLCNQNCIFCYNPRRAEKVNYEKLDAIVDSVARAKVPHVYISGGEPSMLKLDKLNGYIEKLSLNSSVTVLTNGFITMKGLNKKIACLGVPIHGSNATEHESMTGLKGSFEKMKESVRYYVSEGYDVRCILVLTGYNYDKIYDMIKIANELGMESVYVDRYEDGGIGASNSKLKKLKPNLEQFRIGLEQMIQARKDFPIFKEKIGFGTAIPFCIDRRLLEENIGSSCGVGISFCAVNSDGDLRICNQSELVFGNVLEEELKDIWNKQQIDCFRDLSWVEEPCKSCNALKDCICGCKVDANHNSEFSIDYAIREDMDDTIRENIEYINKKYPKIKVKKMIDLNIEIKDNTVLKINRYTKINKETSDTILISRYQSILIDENVVDIINFIKENEFITFKELAKQFTNISKKNLLVSVKRLVYCGVIDCE